MRSHAEQGRPGVAEARSFLFVPGDREDRFAKAAASLADLIVIDLEDAVTPRKKEAAREHTSRWFNSGGAACVRINPAATPWHDDDIHLLATVRGLQAVVVPKADDPAALNQICARLGPGVPVVALVETALGVQRAAEIARLPGVARLAFGSLDFCLDAGVRHDDTALLFARSSLVLAARAAGLPAPVDGVTQDLHDESAVRRNAEHAVVLGFGGKLCIHPRQVDAVNAVFSPSEEEVRWASRVVDGASDGEVSVVDGKMVDKPVLDHARRVLHKHRILTR